MATYKKLALAEGKEQEYEVTTPMPKEVKVVKVSMIDATIASFEAQIVDLEAQKATLEAL